MRNSKIKTKINLGIPGELMSQEAFKALIKEAEDGPFKPIENLVEEVKLKWEKKFSSKTAKKNTPFGPPLSRDKFVESIKAAEKGPFFTHDEFVAKFNLWKKTLKK